MTTTVLLCGDPQQPSEYMYEAMSDLETSFDIAFERMDWMGDASPIEFRDVTMDMEEAGPGAYDTDDIAANLDGVDVLVVHKAPVSRELVEGADLDVVGAARGGTENVAVDACAERGVTVLHAPGRNRNAVADYAVAMLLSRLREIPFNHAVLSEGEWAQVFDPDRLPPDVHTTTIGVVGFGNIGRGVARRLGGFDPDVLAYDPFVDDDAIRETGAEPVDDLHDLLGRVDAVTLHVRLSEDTAGMLGAAEFEAMRESAFLVNTARGGLVDEGALVDALAAGELAGAALDVFRDEPLPDDHPLLDCDGVVLTPHVAGSTRDAVLGGPRIVASDLEAWLRGESPEHVVE